MADNNKPNNKQTGKCTTEDLSTLISLLHEVQPCWKRFGIALGVDFDTLQGIERNPIQKGMTEKMMEVLNAYAKKQGPKKWQDIIKALKILGNNDLASRVPQHGDGKLLYYNKSIQR